MKLFSRHIFVFIFLLFCFFASAQGTWIANAANMKNEIKKVKKDAFILFTGSDWDVASQELLAQKTDKLFSEYGKDFLFYNVDIVRDEELLDPKILKMNYILFSKYHVGDLPYVVVRSFEGDVYFSATIEKGGCIEDKIEDIMKRKHDLRRKKDKIYSSKGKEKTVAIDVFFSSIYNSEHTIYDSLRTEAIEADPNNESNLIGKFKFVQASLNAERLILQKKYLLAADEYIVVLKEGYLSSEEKQNAWYQIAYLYALSKRVGNEKVIYCLEKSINAAPSSETVPRLKEIIDSIKKS